MSLKLHLVGVDAPVHPSIVTIKTVGQGPSDPTKNSGRVEANIVRPHHLMDKKGYYLVKTFSLTLIH